MDEAAVFLAQCAVPEQRRETEVEEVGERARLGGPAVGGPRSQETPVEVCELVCEEALEVGIFLVRADDVGREGVWVWRAREGGGGRGCRRR